MCTSRATRSLVRRRRRRRSSVSRTSSSRIPSPLRPSSCSAYRSKRRGLNRSDGATYGGRHPAEADGRDEPRRPLAGQPEEAPRDEKLTARPAPGLTVAARAAYREDSTEIPEVFVRNGEPWNYRARRWPPTLEHSVHGTRHWRGQHARSRFDRLAALLARDRRRRSGCARWRELAVQRPRSTPRTRRALRGTRGRAAARDRRRLVRRADPRLRGECLPRRRVPLPGLPLRRPRGGRDSGPDGSQERRERLLEAERHLHVP